MLITTKYGNRANSNSGCIRVQCGDVRKAYPYDQTRNSEENHRRAAMMFALEKLKLSPAEMFTVTMTNEGWAFVREITARRAKAGDYQ